MNNQRPAMFVPALIGGGLAGILSGIPFVNCLCCLWVIGGAMLSAHLLAKDSPVRLGAGDGAIVGVFAGIIAAVVDLFVRIPFQAMSEDFVRNMMERFSEYADDMPSIWQSWLEGGGFETSLTVSLVGLLISAVVFSVLGALGGILGISLFGKKPVPTEHDKGVLNAPEDSSNRQS